MVARVYARTYMLHMVSRHEASSTQYNKRKRLHQRELRHRERCYVLVCHHWRINESEYQTDRWLVWLAYLVGM